MEMISTSIAPDNNSLKVSNSDLEKLAMANMKICSSRPEKKLLIVEASSWLQRRSWKLKKSKEWAKRRQIMIRPRRRRPRGLIRSRPKHCSLVQRKVKTLKELVPNSSDNLDGLFKETADYIFNLQKKVQLLQTMVHILCPIDSQNS